MRINLGGTGLKVFPLQLGGNTLGFTADRDTSFRILDAYASAGGNFIDTADFYSVWAPGNVGGESETVIGEWLESRGCRDEMVVATKVGMLEPYTVLDRKHIDEALARSLDRLRTDRIDLYYAHQDDLNTSQEDTAAAFDGLVRAGLVRTLGASNFSPDRLRSALTLARQRGLHSYQVIQDEYSLVNRQPFETGTMPVAVEFGLVNIPYRSLAKGFLSGRYRPGGSWQETTHTSIATSYLEKYGTELLGTVETIARRHDTTMSAVGLAWLTSRPTVALPLSGVRTLEQLDDILPAAGLVLDDDEVDALTALTAPSD
ncbi:Predicted oxidoreductase [Micromonospora pallida]|uniref:Predicted oxidoreductase n=1 Tax=Micromonospora pallida TaxID=145854 RepID=A0A1C6SFJ7_9ACTN|nr:aldo/keto reductase [Micromonospora pallida]SCL28225.1 Predicted oxidoreductase [Micromonospora pallida]